MIKNPIVQNILSVLAILVIGYLLLNLTFIFDWLLHSAVIWIIKLFVPIDNPEITFNWFPPVMHALFVIVIALISWFIFKSKLGVTYKAIYLTVPTAVTLVTLGIFLYRWPLISYSVGALLTLAVLYIFYRARQSWLYYLSVLVVSAALLIIGILGVDI